MKKKSLGRVPLERALSKLGIASRNEAKALIQSGQVKVHGSIEKNPLRRVNPDTAHVEVLGKKRVREETLLLLFHKPKGVLTTKCDPEGRPTIYDVLPKEFHSLHAVGRLDQHTTGLLLLTNNTKLSSFLTEPKNKISRVYLVGVRGCFSKEDQEKACVGVQDREEWLKAETLEILKTSRKESLIKISLNEGKNREIRRLCLRLQHEVLSLKRIRFGAYELGELKEGEFKLLSMNEYFSS